MGFNEFNQSIPYPTLPIPIQSRLAATFRFVDEKSSERNPLSIAQQSSTSSRNSNTKFDQQGDIPYPIAKKHPEGGTSSAGEQEDEDEGTECSLINFQLHKRFHFHFVNLSCPLLFHPSSSIHPRRQLL